MMDHRHVQKGAVKRPCEARRVPASIAIQGAPVAKPGGLFRSGIVPRKGMASRGAQSSVIYGSFDETSEQTVEITR
jgi:hypothetical protein